MKVKDHNKYRLFDYNNDLTNKNFELGQVLFNKKEKAVGVVIQLHSDGDCRTDQYGNTSTSESRLATIEEIQKYKPQIISDLV